MDSKKGREQVSKTKPDLGKRWNGKQRRKRIKVTGKFRFWLAGRPKPNRNPAKANGQIRNYLFTLVSY